MTATDLAAIVKRNQLSFGAGAVALVLGLAVYFRSADLPEAAGQLEQKLAETERLAGNVRNGAQLAEQLAVIAGATKEIDARLGHPTELAQNLQYFYKLEAETGTKLLELRQLTAATATAATPGTPPLAGIAFTVTVRGEYFAVMDFIRRLESGSRYSRVMSAAMGTTGPDRSVPVTLTLGVELLGQP